MEEAVISVTYKNSVNYVSKVTGNGLEDLGSIFGQVRIFSLQLHLPPTQHLIWLCSLDKSDRNKKLISHSHLVPKLKMQ
jgi:hypothetical protein